MDLDLENYQVDAYILMYSVSEPASFGQAVSLLLYLRLDLGSDRPVYLVANKTDLVRQSRVAASGKLYGLTLFDYLFNITRVSRNSKDVHVTQGSNENIKAQLIHQH